MNSLITPNDMRRWQWAATQVLMDLITGAPDLTPLTWKIGTTARLQGSAPSGTCTERLAWLTAWADHLGIDLTARPGPDGMTTYQGRTERIATTGKTVQVGLYDRIQTQPEA